MNTPGGQLPVTFQSQNRKKLRVLGYLLRGGVVPGDAIPIQIDLQNPKQICIKRIEVTLLQHRQVGPTSHVETIFQVDLPAIRDFSGSRLEQVFELMVPDMMLSPSFTYLSPGQISPIATSIRYELILAVKARGLFTDFQISIPVIVGTEPLRSQQPQENPQEKQQQSHSSTEIPIPSAPVMPLEEDELPPTYDSIMNSYKAH